MDANAFDTLTRTLIDPRSRRGTLATLLSGTLGLVGLTQTEAKKKKCPPCKKRKHGKCKKKLPNGTPCAEPVGGATCQRGRCACPSGLTNCAGICRDLKTDEANCGACGTVCTALQVCQEGSCFPTGACPATTTSLCGGGGSGIACSAPADQCRCARSAEGNVVCITERGIACGVAPTCTTSATCVAGSACVDVSGCCVPAVPSGTKFCLPTCPAPVPG